MKIEAVTTYIPAVTPSRSKVLEGSAVRMVPMSLPRVKWLERGMPQESIPVSRPFMLSRPLTDNERESYELFKQGVSIPEIGRMIGASKSTVRDRVARAKKKLGDK